MDLYTNTSYELSRIITERYSTSFSMSARLFDTAIRTHIYAIYGLVRIADEIVDTYRGADAAKQLDDLRQQVDSACTVGYSTNPLVHAFALTARQYGIHADLYEPFFDSMTTDLTASSFTEAAYRQYIYGSAEVVGLMCLRVFVSNDQNEYERQCHAAAALGAAYQKINFLRDIKSDYGVLGRVYFPGLTFESFDDAAKQTIIKDIDQDLRIAVPGIAQLPTAARSAVQTSYRYYAELLEKLRTTPAATIKKTRIRLPNARKLWLLAQSKVGR